LNPLDRPTLCPFCLKTVPLAAHVGACPAVFDENPQPAELPPVTGVQPTMQDQIKEILKQDDSSLIKQTILAWSGMFKTKVGREPTAAEVEQVRAQAQANLNRLRGV